MKPKLCRVCKVSFDPFNSLQFACSVPCALEYSRKQREGNDRRAEKAAKAKERKRNREARVRLKTRSQWLAEAQHAFNAYIRKRDSGNCISCGRDHSGQYHAGHYRSVGACPELRFDEDNCHKQCAPCNNHKSGNAIDYRINLLKKIGIERVEALEGPHSPLKLSIDEIKAIKSTYKAKLREMS